MRTLTQNQKNFIKENFFRNTKYNGWENIADKLLNSGSCVVAGTECIWIGGIGNFIKTSEAKDAVDCSLYEFNLEYFLSSVWYKDVYQFHMEKLTKEKTELENFISEIEKLK